MIGKIEREEREKKESYYVLLNPTELEWYDINTAQEKNYVQVQILGVNKKPIETPLRLFTHIRKNSDNDAVLLIDSHFLNAYDLKNGDVIRFHVYAIKPEVREE